MIAITTKQRATVEVDGARFTVRPLTGAEVLVMKDAAGSNEMALRAARYGLVEVVGVVIDGKPATVADVDTFPPHAITAIFAKVAEMTFPDRFDAKNSTSPRPTTPEPRSDPRTGENGSSTASGSTPRDDQSFTI